MSFLGGILGGNSQAKTIPAVSGLQLQTSVQGKCIAIVYGTTRVAPNLIWYGDFVSIPQYSSGGSGGKGGVLGGGGGKGGQPSGYIYQTAVAMALCEGPINGVNNIYVDKNITNLANQGLSLFTGTLGQAPWGYLVTNHGANTSEAHTIPSSGPYTVAVLLPWTADLGVTGTTVSINFTQVFSAPSSGQYELTNNGGNSFTYTFAAADADSAIVIRYSNVYDNVTSTSATIPANSPYTFTLKGVNRNIGVTATAANFTPVVGSPALNQYSVTAGVYTFNSGNAGASITISYDSTGGQDIGYSLTAYVASNAYPLGSSAQLPNNNFEVEGVYSNAVAQEVTGEQDTVPGSPYQIEVEYAAEFLSDNGVIDQSGNVFTQVGSSPGYQQYSVSAGTYTFSSANEGSVVNISYAASVGPDADPSLVAADLLSNADYGAGFPSARIGDLSTYQAYCIATGLLISPCYDTQTQASSMFDDIATATNSGWVWSGGKLTLVPYGDQSITANGYTYTPPSSPLYSLTDDDLERNTNGTGGASATFNDDPVLMTRKRPSDAYNSIKLEWLDRNNDYNPAIIEAKDQAMIDTFGLRQDASRQFHMFCNGNAARLSVQLQLQRQAIRNTYQFQLDQRYVVLDPMDIIAITDSKLGLSAQWVRVIEVTENDDSTITISAEEYLAGTGSAPQYTFQSGTAAFNADYNQSSGNANAPTIFEPPVQITSTGLEVWLAVSGGETWGGCDVYSSSDNSNYKLLGRISGAARMGTLTAILASGSDPDTTDTLSIDLSESFGELLSGTQSDADANHTLSYVDGELVSYSNVTLTAQYQYNLDTYLRRGQYGTPISSHAIGSKFARLDNGIFTIPYDKSRIGQTLYLKLLSFNLYGGGIQGLSDVDPYTYTIQGPPVPQQVQNFSAQQQGAVVAFSWTDLANDSGLEGYDIAFGIAGSVWADKELLTEAHRGTEMTNASVPPGAWEFSIRAHDIADQLGPESLVELTVTNEDDVIASAVQEPVWPGTLVNFYLHYTGVLIPLCQNDASLYVAYGDEGSRIFGLANPFYTPGGSMPLRTYYYSASFLDSTGESTIRQSPFNTLVIANNLLLLEVTFNPTFVHVNATTGINIYVGTTSTNLTKQNATPLIPSGGSVTWTEPVTGLISGTSPPTLDTTGWQVFDSFVPDPFTSASYTAPTLDASYNDTMRVWASTTANLGPGQTGAAAELQLEIDTWLTGQSDPDVYIPWTIGYLLLRYLNAQIVYENITDGNVSYISDFTPTIDKAPVIENVASVVIAPGGTSVVFPNSYHNDPNVVATVVGSTALYATCSGISTTGCTINVWNNSGVSVGGTVNYQSTGE